MFLCFLPMLPLSCHLSHLAWLSLLPQQSLKADSRPLEGSATQLPILADMLLYYCRFAARPVLLQVYQTEVRHAVVSPRLPSYLWASWPGPSLGPAVPTALHPHPLKSLCWSTESHTDVHTLLVPPPADLRHGGEDHGDLHPISGAGSLCNHSCYQGFGWALREPLQRWAGGGVRKKREQGEAGS